MILRGVGVADIPLPGNLFPFFSSPPTSGMEVQFYGMLGGRTSIANVSTAIARELTNRFSRTAVSSYNGDDFLDESLEKFSGRDPGADIAIYYGLPKRVSLPPGFGRHTVKIGGFVCETDRIHPSWVNVCNDCDLVCVPSRFCRDAFANSGVVRPVLVVPHGLDPEYVPYREPPETGPFTFFNVFDAGSYIQRKSAEELIRTFCRMFEPVDDVRLVLRTQNNARIRELCERYDSRGLVSIEAPVTLGVREFARRYSDIHCVVHPSKGEGFGLIPFQAIACERPVIAPAATGMADYLNTSNALPLRTSGQIPGIGLGNRSGLYCSIDEEHLGILMRHVYETWPAEYQRVRRVGPAFREAHGWRKALAGLVAVIEALRRKNLDPATARECVEDLMVSHGRDFSDACLPGRAVV